MERSIEVLQGLKPGSFDGLPARLKPCPDTCFAKETFSAVSENQQPEPHLPINQRVNSAIGTAEKIERDSRSKKREKGFDSPFDSPIELQLAVCLQQNLDKGGVQKSLLEDQHF
jgi:hypothetical protein